MNIIDLRQKKTKDNVSVACDKGTPITDRRKNAYPYGSAEWLAHLRQQGLERPPYDRRSAVRRTAEEQAQYDALQQKQVRYARVLLTPVEKKILADIYLTEKKS